MAGAENDLQVPFIDGKTNQEKLYWYNKLTKAMPTLRNLPIATFDPELIYYRLVNAGEIPESSGGGGEGGSIWYSGYGAPVFTGSANDKYLDLNNGDVYTFI